MLAFPSMLIEPARQAGMKVPSLNGKDEWDTDAFPHFTVFCNVQLCHSVQWGEQWENAKVIAAIPDKKIKTIALIDLIQLGLQWQS